MSDLIGDKTDEMLYIMNCFVLMTMCGATHACENKNLPVKTDSEIMQVKTADDHAPSVHKAQDAKYFMRALDDFILIVLGCLCNLSQNPRIPHQPTSMGGEQI